MRVRLPREFTRREKSIIDEEINKLILQRDMDYAADIGVDVKVWEEEMRDTVYAEEAGN